MHQKLYKMWKKLIKRDTCIKIYEEKELLYLETDASGVDHETGLLQVRKGISKWVINFVCIHNWKYFKLLKQSKLIKLFLTSFHWPSC